MKFQLDPTKTKDFRHRRPLSKSLTFGNVVYTRRCQNERVLQWGVYGENIAFLVGSNLNVVSDYIKKTLTHIM